MDNAGKKPVWSVQPPKGMLKGDYYRIEERFPPYYPGVEGSFPPIRVTWALWRR